MQRFWEQTLSHTAHILIILNTQKKNSNFTFDFCNISNEKPAKFVSNYAVVGLYIFNGDVSYHAKKVKPSKRGEIEITDLINFYINANQCKLFQLNENDYWFDAGSASGLLEASNVVNSIQSRHGILIGSPEIAAFQSNAIDIKVLDSHCKKINKSLYGEYLGKFYNENS